MAGRGAPRLSAVPPDPAAVAAILAGYPPAPRLWVAYSGGLDSHVLLHLLAGLAPRLPAPLAAVHVHHGLSPRADEWEAHCAGVCAGLGVPLRLLRVDARPAPGQSPEAAARDARYRALAELLAGDELLLTAQHLDDQAETLLLQQLRGGGLRGMAGMPRLRRLGGGWLGRPLLGFSRASLAAYARGHALAWVEDESNSDTGLDRNYLRHEVLPRLRVRWPAAARSLGRSADHCAEALELLEALAAEDLSRAGGGGPGGSLAVAELGALSPARQRNLLRHWIAARGAPLPPGPRLESLRRQCLEAGADRSPRIAWGGVEVRRHRGRLHLLGALAAPPAEGLPWRLDGALELPVGLGRLCLEPAVGRGLAESSLAGAAGEVRFRDGGERCQPAGRAGRHTLKQLFQEAGVPPWERGRTPLLYLDGRLAAVGGRWVCAPFAAAPGEAGRVLRWEPGPGAGGAGSIVEKWPIW